MGGGERAQGPRLPKPAAGGEAPGPRAYGNTGGSPRAARGRVLAPAPTGLGEGGGAPDRGGLPREAESSRDPPGAGGFQGWGGAPESGTSWDGGGGGKFLGQRRKSWGGGRWGRVAPTAGVRVAGGGVARSRRLTTGPGVRVRKAGARGCVP